MKHKTFRTLLSLVLVCVLLIGWSPIRARAVGVDQFVGVAIDEVGLYAQAGALSTGAAVFAWVLVGLGVIVTTAQAIDLMNQYTEFSGELETSIYYYPDGSWSYGVDMGFVERVRNFLFDSGVVVCNDVPVFDEPGMRDAVALAATKPYACVVRSTKTYICYSSFPFYITNESGVEKLKVIGDYSFMRYNPSWISVPYVAINGGTVEYFGTDYCESEYELGFVAPNTVTIPAGYPEWHINARPVTNPDTDEEITVLPIPLNPSADPETQIGTLTQPDIWQGTLADPMPDTGTDGSLLQTPWETFKKWISEGWQSIIQAIPTPESIAEAVGNVIKSIFVPDADFISEKWNAIRSRFDFADSISSSGELILDVLNGIDPEPPVIYVDLGDAEGSYYLGGQVAFLDLRWYERYKPTGDAIISAFLWLVFVWRMFIKLPGIIGGLPGDFVMQGVTDLGLADWLPARKKEYENQRQENRRFFKK